MIVLLSPCIIMKQSLNGEPIAVNPALIAAFKPRKSRNLGEENKPADGCTLFMAGGQQIDVSNSFEEVKNAWEIVLE